MISKKKIISLVTAISIFTTSIVWSRSRNTYATPTEKTTLKTWSRKIQFKQNTLLSQNQYNANKTTGRVVSGDFNGDGNVEVAAFYDYGNAATTLHVWDSDGNKLSSATTDGWWKQGPGNYNSNFITSRVVSGDFDGDEKDEIGSIYDYGNGTSIIHILSIPSTKDTQFIGSMEWASKYNGALVIDRVVVATVNGRESIIAMEDGLAKSEEKKSENKQSETKNGDKVTELQNQILSRARGMIDYRWTPTKDLRGWNGYIFAKGKEVTGIPYSQTEYQTDLEAFKKALQKSDFYDSNYNPSYDSRKMPKYGNDCSGFVSFSWGTKRMTTYGIMGSDLVRGFDIGKEKLKPGDAFVNNGHTFIYVSTNSDVTYTCYEQTPPKTKISIHSPETLKKKDIKYID